MTRLAPPRPWLAAAGSLLFLVTAALVANGSLTGVDRYAASHLMPWIGPRHATSTLASLALPQLRGSFAHALVALATYPAAVVPSLVLVGLAGRRLASAAAATWIALWIAGNAVELVGKAVVQRPVVFTPFFDTPFGHSLPSGHTIRAFVVAGALATAWRPAAAAYGWAAGVGLALVALGDHTPTDVVAGAFVALALAGWAPRRSGSGSEEQLDDDVREEQEPRDLDRDEERQKRRLTKTAARLLLGGRLAGHGGRLWIHRPLPCDSPPRSRGGTS